MHAEDDSRGIRMYLEQAGKELKSVFVRQADVHDDYIRFCLVEGHASFGSTSNGHDAQSRHLTQNRREAVQNGRMVINE